MTVDLDTRIAESPEATEVYLWAAADSALSLEQQARDAFTRIRDRLLSMKACIIQERVFCAVETAGMLRTVRGQVYGELDDGVEASYLVSQAEGACPFVGVQVHAVAGVSDVEVVRLGQAACGRVVRMSDRGYLTLSAIADSSSEQAPDQACAIFNSAESILEQFGADFLSVARTWMWLGDILSWYDDFNHVRTEFFRERGLVGAGTRQSMPASTGIGLGPASGEQLSMDLVAVLGAKGTTEYLGALGKQQCALEYGSAFSRAARVYTPAGRTVFVSGTASIDASGATTNIDDGPAQIETTIENVRAVLGDMGLGDNDVVQVMAYCKTTDIKRAFETFRSQIDWPWVTVVCDVCRDDLLFEIEAAAISGAKRIE